MRMIMGLDRPDAGQARIGGKSHGDLRWPLREVGALLEAKAFHPGRTARAHLTALAASNAIGRRRVEKFPASFAGDLPAGQAAFMADSQVPWGVNALAGTISEPAWRIKPSWYLVATDDRMIPPPAQRAMAERASSTVTEVPGSHSIYLSRPAAVAALITQAAAATRG
jgi:pimeloyl-ACP methyl ester carboxylesterase